MSSSEDSEDIKLQVGDLVVAQVQYSGCSYHNIFGQCVKVTPKGYRIKTIGKKQTDRRAVDYYVWTTYVPNVTELSSGTFGINGETFIIQKNGHKNLFGTRHGIYFKKYTEPVEDYSDPGD